MTAITYRLDRIFLKTGFLKNTRNARPLENKATSTEVMATKAKTKKRLTKSDSKDSWWSSFQMSGLPAMVTSLS